jgi:hypothetical protein
MNARLASIAVALGTLLACGGGDTAAPDPEAPAAKAVKTEAPKKREAPAGSVVFDDADAPFTTIHPTEGFATAKSCDDKACTWSFGLPTEEGKVRDDCSVALTFPKGKMSQDELETNFVKGPVGVFGQHEDWSKTGEVGGNPGMPWLRKAISFEAGEGTVGRVLVGEGDAGSFRVIELIDPAELSKMQKLIGSIYRNFELRPPSGH